MINKWFNKTCGETNISQGSLFGRLHRMSCELLADFDWTLYASFYYKMVIISLLEFGWVESNKLNTTDIILS